MHTPQRVGWSVIALLFVLAVSSLLRAPAVSGEQSNGDRCDEFKNMLGTFHAFGGGSLL